MLYQDVTIEPGRLIDQAAENTVGPLGCPVLVRSAPTLRPELTDSLRRPEVVAGIHCAEEIPVLLPVATREAAARGIPLCVFTAGRTAADRLVESALRAENDVPWRLVRTMGERASAALLRYVEPEDLLVLGSRGPVRLSGLAAGSVSRAVLGAMPCDVLLVPIRPPADEEIVDGEEERHE